MSAYVIFDVEISDMEKSAMIPLSFAKDGVRLNYFSLITTVGTPQTVTAQELRLECMFPADEVTESAHGQFIAAHSPRPIAQH